MTSIKKAKKQAPKFGVSDYEDLAVINSILQGNKNSFDRLFKKYHPIIRFKIRKNLTSEAEVQDVASDIFIKVFENIHKYKKDYTFNAWLTAVAKNCLIDYIRKRNAEKVNVNSISIDEYLQQDEGKTSAEMTFDIPDNSIAPAMEADEKLEKIAMLNVIYNAMGTLPDIEREIMELYYFHDFSYQEVCDKLSIGLSCMKLKLMRAKDKLKSKIKMKRAMVEVAGTYSLEQINVDKMYKLNQEVFQCE